MASIDALSRGASNTDLAQSHVEPNTNDINLFLNWKQPETPPLTCPL